ncbi:MAG: hypothetical protein O2964_07590 [Verrucomicrobia bacterium]|nr:hypothetical protein [Verrucomicrobiota bacterium]
MPAGTLPAGIFVGGQVERGVLARNPHGLHSLFFTSQGKPLGIQQPNIRAVGGSGRTGTVRSTRSSLKVVRAVPGAPLWHTNSNQLPLWEACGFQ